MTKDEFEQGYAKRSKVTVEWLHENGQFGLPCYCEQEGCEGWQMVYLTQRAADGAWRCGCGVEVPAHYPNCFRCGAEPPRR
jgi:hypothetical protein